MFNGALNVSLADPIQTNNVPVNQSANVSAPVQTVSNMTTDTTNTGLLGRINSLFKLIAGQTVLDGTKEQAIVWLKANWYWLLIPFSALFIGLYYFVKWAVRKANKKGSKSLYK